MSDGLDRFPQVDLDLKALVVEAYHLGMHELLYIVPFVAKVLESCAKSKVRLLLMDCGAVCHTLGVCFEDVTSLVSVDSS